MRHQTARATTTKLRPPHTPAHGVPGERIGTDAELGDRGGRGRTPSRGRIALSRAWWRTIIKKCKTQNEFLPNTSVAAVRTSVAHGKRVVWWVNGLVDGSVVGWVVGSFCTWVSASAPVGGKLSFSSMPACSGDAYEPTHMFAAVPGSVVTHGAG